jgi:hypothetical protein
LHYQQQPQSNWVSLLNGTTIPSKQRSVRTISPAFNLSLAPHQEQTYYLQVYSRIKLFRIDIKIGEAQDSYLFDLGHITLVKMFISPSLILLLVNILMYFSVRDSMYLYYSAYSVGLVLTVTFNNLLDLFFELPIIDRSMLYLIYNATIIFLTLFIGKALDPMRTLPWFNVILNIICIFALITAGFTWYDINYYSIVIFIPTAVFLLCVTVYTAIAGNTSGRLLAIGLAIFLSGTVIVSLSNMGLIPSNLFTDHASLLGALIEMIFFQRSYLDEHSP